MAEYQNLAQLRADLSSDEAGPRTRAYEAVLTNTDVKPEDVLSSEPPVEDLEDGGVIPINEEADLPDSYEHRERMVELLEQIAENTEAE